MNISDITFHHIDAGDDQSIRVSIERRDNNGNITNSTPATPAEVGEIVGFLNSLIGCGRKAIKIRSEFDPVVRPFSFSSPPKET